MRRVCDAGLSSLAHITGDRVSATIVDMITDTAMVMVNWRNSCPVMPGRKLTGTNTAQSTRLIAMSALPRPSMARRVASGASRCSFSMMRSTFSTTTMASSTTMPIARMSPNRVSMLSEKSNTSITPNVPMSDIGTAMTGISVARQLCSDRNTTRITSSRASKKVRYTWCIDSEMYVVMSKGIS